MKIRDRILEVLKDSSKTTKEIRQAIPDKHNRILAATISNNPDVFLRLEKGIVGLKNRDEHLITGRRIRNGKFPLYKKLVNALGDGTKTIKQLYTLFPEEKPVSIRATVNVRPDLFIRIKTGIIGRSGRDEWLREREIKRKEPKPKRVTVSQKLESFLATGEKTLDEIMRAHPNILRKSITCKLALNPNIERVGREKYRLTERRLKEKWGFAIISDTRTNL